MTPADIRALVTSLPGWTQTGDELKVNCPKCGDTTRNLQVNTKRDLFHCWRCHYKGHARKLFRELGLPFVGGGSPSGTDVPRRTSSPSDGDGSPVPYNAFGSRRRDAWPYLAERAWSLASKKLGGRRPPEWWGWGSGDYSARLVIPVRLGGKPVTFQARALYKWQKQKYISGKHPHFRRTSDCFYKVRGEGKTIALVEGPFDAVVAAEILDHPAWGVFGTYLSEWQRNHLARVASTVVVWMDPDAPGEAAAQAIAANLAAMGLDVQLARSATDPKGANKTPTIEPAF